MHVTVGLIQPAMFYSPIGIGCTLYGTLTHFFPPLVLLQSQAEAHYKGNRHARRVKGIETSKSRPQEGDKTQTVPPTSSPSPPGAPGSTPDSEPSKAGEREQKIVNINSRNRKGAHVSFVVK